MRSGQATCRRGRGEKRFEKMQEKGLERSRGKEQKPHFHTRYQNTDHLHEAPEKPKWSADHIHRKGIVRGVALMDKNDPQGRHGGGKRNKRREKAAFRSRKKGYGEKEVRISIEYTEMAGGGATV